MRKNVIIPALAVVAVLAAIGIYYLMMPKAPAGFIILKDGLALDDDVCAAKGISDQVTVYHSTDCGACKATVPVLKEIESASGKRFEFIEITANRDRMMQLGMMPEFIPTVIINCKVYVGYRTKDQFLNLLR